MIEPIVKEILVPTSPDRAFQLFTGQITNWWPLDTHSISAASGQSAKSVAMDGRIGGSITDQTFDGQSVIWGKITRWQPGVVLAFTWHLRRPKPEQTHVTVNFLAQDGATLVRLEHSGWDAQGEQGADNRAQYQSGWDTVLARYIKIT